MKIKLNTPYAFVRVKPSNRFTDFDSIKTVEFRDGGKIDGPSHHNEASWRWGEGHVFEILNAEGEVTTRFDRENEIDHIQLPILHGDFLTASPEEGVVEHGLIELLTPAQAIAKKRLGVVIATNEPYREATMPLLLESMERAMVPKEMVTIVNAQNDQKNGKPYDYHGWKMVNFFQDSWEYAAMACAGKYPELMPDTDYLFFVHDTTEVFPDFWEKINQQLPAEGLIDMVIHSKWCTFVSFSKQFLINSLPYWGSLHGMSKNRGRSVEFGRAYRNGAWFKSALWTPGHNPGGPSHRSALADPNNFVFPYADKASRVKRVFGHLGFIKYSRGDQSHDKTLDGGSKVVTPKAATPSEKKREELRLLQEEKRRARKLVDDVKEEKVDVESVLVDLTVDAMRKGWNVNFEQSDRLVIAAGSHAEPLESDLILAVSRGGWLVEARSSKLVALLRNE